jgi:predicted RecB family endonuclease
MSERCDKHRYSHVSESSCRQCLIDEQADTIAEMKKEALVVEVLTNGKDKLIASMEAHGSALQTECENAKKYMLELSQSITSVSIEKKALQERIAELEKAARRVVKARNGMNSDLIVNLLAAIDDLDLLLIEPTEGSE